MTRNAHRRYCAREAMLLFVCVKTPLVVSAKKETRTREREDESFAMNWQNYTRPLVVAVGFDCSQPQQQQQHTPAHTREEEEEEEEEEGVETR